MRPPSNLAVLILLPQAEKARGEAEGEGEAEGDADMCVNHGTVLELLDMFAEAIALFRKVKTTC